MYVCHCPWAHQIVKSPTVSRSQSYKGLCPLCGFVKQLRQKKSTIQSSIIASCTNERAHNHTTEGSLNKKCNHHRICIHLTLHHGSVTCVVVQSIYLINVHKVSRSRRVQYLGIYFVNSKQFYRQFVVPLNLWKLIMEGPAVAQWLDTLCRWDTSQRVIKTLVEAEHVERYSCSLQVMSTRGVRLSR